MNEHRVCFSINRALERAPKFGGWIDAEPRRFKSGIAGGGFAGFELRLIEVQVVKQRDPFNLREYLPGNLNPFARDFWCIKEDTRHIAAGPIEALRCSGRNGCGFRFIPARYSDVKPATVPI